MILRNSENKFTGIECDGCGAQPNPGDLMHKGGLIGIKWFFDTSHTMHLCVPCQDDPRFRDDIISASHSRCPIITRPHTTRSS